MASEKIIERKKKEVEEIGKIFEMDGVYLFDYRGLTVPKMQELRKRVKDLNANVKVVKNRLAIKYFESEKRDEGREVFKGPLAIAYAGESFIDVAKILVDSEKDFEHLSLKAGFIEGNFADRNEVIALAKLPGKDQLMAQLALSMSMPIKKFGASLAAPLKNVLILMNNLKDKKEKEEKQ